MNEDSTKKTYKNPSNKQEKLLNIEHSFQVNNGTINENHNSKKEGLGRNTKR